MAPSPSAPSPTPPVRRRSTLWTLGILLALSAAVVYLSVAQVRWECEVWMEFRGHAEHRTGASATRDEAVRSAVTSACGTLASGMAESMACDRTPPVKVECREY